MSYYVEWRPEVMSRVERDYLRLSSQARQRFMDAVDVVERLLSNRPMEIGESREEESHRVMLYPPLAIEYRVEHRLQQVTIYGAKLYPEA